MSWSSRTPISSNVPSHMFLLLQTLSLLLWFPLVLRVGTLLGLEDAFDDGHGSSLVFSFLFLWLFGLHKGFYRWLKSLDWNPNEQKKTFGPVLFSRRTYRSCIVYYEECFSRLQWYISRYRVKTWRVISQTVA